MSEKETSPAESEWLCSRCGLPLEIGKVDVGYLGSVFPVDLLRCSRCGQVFVPEELAEGKMAEVEKMLEDK
ncbi:MAG: DVU_1557 family redox protein [Syntrophobacteraceae bacterium]